MSKQNTQPNPNSISLKELLNKKELLEQAKNILKQEFVGIDIVIDEIIHSVEAWYIFPQGQIRPTVINLFGMTGVGKTSLVNRMCELIKMDTKLFRFDIGDYTGEDTKLKYDFSHKLNNNENKPVVLMFDEFQLGRTIGEQGEEIDRTGLRALWDLLDNGKIAIIDENYYTHKVITLALKLQHCIENDVESKNGIITKNQSFHTGIFYSQKIGGRKGKFENEDGDIADTKYFIPEDSYYNIRQVLKDKKITSSNVVRDKFLKMSHLEAMKYLTDILETNLQPIVHDFSQALIFIIGNIDEVYSMSGVIDPDYDADIFHKNSLNISITRIKEALKQRFRAEQIARLGNNVIVYPSFSANSYHILIQMELDKFKIKVIERYGIDIDFDKSVNDIIYKEGVFPTQGTRPVFTTINSLIETYISKIVSDIVIEQINSKHINWKFINATSEYEIKINSKEKSITKYYKLKLKVDNLRKSTLDDTQAHIAVHEAGHAVLSCMHLGILPEEIVSRTAGTSLGFCRINMPDINTKELLLKDIVVGLGGYVAEKLIFGENLLSNGSVNDIEKVTERAIGFVKFYGMHNLPIAIGVENLNMNHSHFFEDGKSNKAVEDLVKKSLDIATKTIKKNKTLLLKISEYLSNHSRMNKELVAEFVKKHTVLPPKLKDSNNYHDFRDKLNKELKKMPKKRNILIKKPLKTKR